ncbi:MAG: S-layer homology domain-containing protein [Sedimentibacter sp.]
MLKKIISFILIFSTLLSLVTPAYAYDDMYEQKLKEELRIAVDETEYPNGLFEFLTTRMNTSEDKTSVEFAIVRKGGISGKASITFKAIDVSAKYGEDYTISVPKGIFSETLPENQEAKPLIESLSNGDSVTDEIEVPVVTGAAITGEEIETPVVTGGAIIGEVENIYYEELPPPIAGNPLQVSPKLSLREAREAFTGKESDRLDWREAEEKEIENAVDLHKEMYEGVPGVSYTFEFAEGEYIKKIRFNTIDDKISEDEEQVVFVLLDPVGASTGESLNGFMNIEDNEEKENVEFEILEKEIFVDENSSYAEVTVKRTAGLYRYGFINVGTASLTAMPEIDYTPIITELKFVPGQETQKVRVPILDGENEKDLQFLIKLDAESTNLSKSGNLSSLVTIKAIQGTTTGIVYNNFKTMLASTEENLTVKSFSTMGPVPISSNNTVEYGGVTYKVKVLGWQDVVDSYGQYKWPRINYIYQDITNGTTPRRVTFPVDLTMVDKIMWGWSNYSNGTGSNTDFYTYLSIANDWVPDYSKQIILNTRKGRFTTIWDEVYPEGRVLNDTERNKTTMFFGTYVRNQTFHSQANLDYVYLLYTPIKVSLMSDMEDEDANITPKIWTSSINSTNETKQFIGALKFEDGTSRAKTFYDGDVVRFEPNINNLVDSSKVYLWGYKIEREGGLSGGDYYYVKGNTLNIRDLYTNKMKDYNGNIIKRNEVLLTGGLAIYPVYKAKNAFVKINFDTDMVGMAQDSFSNGQTLKIGMLDTVKYNAFAKTGYYISDYGHGDANYNLETITTAETERFLESYSTESADSTIIEYNNESNLHPINGLIINNALPNELDFKPQKTFSNLKVNYSLPSLEVRIDPKSGDKDKGIIAYIPKEGEGDAKAGDKDTPIVISPTERNKVYTLNGQPVEGYRMLWKDWTGDNLPLVDKDGKPLVDDKTGKPLQYNGKVDTAEAIALGEYWNIFEPRRKAVAGNTFSYIVDYDKPLILYSFEPKPTQGEPGEVYGYVNLIGGNILDNKEGKAAEAYKRPLSGISVNVNGHSLTTDENGYFEIEHQDFTTNEYHSITAKYKEVYYTGRANVNSTTFIDIIEYDSFIPYNFIIKEGNNLIKPKLMNNKDAYFKFSFDVKSLKPGLSAEKALVRIYSKEGIQRGTAIEVAPSSGTFSFDFNPASKGVVPGDTMTIQLVDQNELAHLEHNVGFSFQRYLSVFNLLTSFKSPASGAIDMVGAIDVAFDLGLSGKLDDEDSPMKKGEDEWIITFGFDKKWEKSLKENSEVEGEDKSAKEGLKDAAKAGATGGETKETVNKAVDTDNKEKKSASLTADMEFGLSTSLYLRMVVDKDPTSKNYGDAYFKEMIISATVSGNVNTKVEIQTPIGVTVFVALELGGDITGMMVIEQYHNNKFYFDGDGKIDFSNAGTTDFNRDFTIYGKLIVRPYISITAGAEIPGGEISVNGKAQFDMNFTTSGSGSGNVTLTSELALKVLIFNFNWEIANKTWDLFSYGSLRSFNANNLFADNDYLYDSVENYEINSREYLENRGGWQGGGSSRLMSLFAVGDNAYNEKTLQTGVYPYPYTLLSPIGENQQLLIFLDDDTQMDDRNRTQLYFSIYSGSSWSQPQKVDNDNTPDDSPWISDMGDKILVAWSSATNPVGQDDTVMEVLNNRNIKASLFDKETGKFEEIQNVTSEDVWSDTDPYIAYWKDKNEKENLMIIYTITDYKSTASDNKDAVVGDIVNAYSALAYRFYDFENKQWGGQGFLDVSKYAEVDETSLLIAEDDEEGWKWSGYWSRLPGDNEVTMEDLGTDPLIVDSNAIGYEDFAVFAYSIDIDKNIETTSDRELFIQLYSFAEERFYPAIHFDDTKGQLDLEFVESNDNVYLYFISDGDIVTIDIGYLYSQGFLSYNIEGEATPVLVLNKLKGIYRKPEVAVKHKYETKADEFGIERRINENIIDQFMVKSNDDNVYVMWTESALTYEDGIDPYSDEAALPENQYREKQIYAARQILSDEKIITLLVDEEGNPLTYPQYDDGGNEIDYSITPDVNGYTGKVKAGDPIFVESRAAEWSEPVKLTNEQGANLNDIDFEILSDGNLRAVFVKGKSEIMDVAGQEMSVENVSSRALMTADFDVSIKKAEMTMEEIPLIKQNESVYLYVNLENKALNTLEDITLELYQVKNGVEEKFDEIKGIRLRGGEEKRIGLSWQVPENIEGATIKALLKHDGEILSTAQQDIVTKSIVDILETSAKIIDRNSVKITGIAENNGNIDDVDAVIYAHVSGNVAGSMNIGQLKVGESKRFEFYASILPDMFEVTENDDGSINELMKLNINSTGEGANVNLERFASKENLDIINNIKNFDIMTGERNIVDSVSLEKGSSVDIIPNLTYTDNDLSKPRIVYVSSNEDVVNVFNSYSTSESHDLMIGNETGTAKITIYALPENNRIILSEFGMEVVDNITTLPEKAIKVKSFDVHVYNPGSNDNSDDNDTKTEPIKTDHITTIEATTQKDLLGNVSAHVTLEQMSSAINKAMATMQTGDMAPNIEINVTEGKDKVEVTMPAEALKEASRNEIEQLTISMPEAKITLDKETLSGISEQANEDIKITVSKLDNSNLTEEVLKITGSRPVYDLSIVSGGSRISEFDGTVTVSVNYIPNTNEDINSLVIYYIDDNGLPKLMTNCKYDEKTNSIIFKTSHFSKFAVGYNKVSFQDVKDSEWYSKAVNFIASRGITTGTGEGIFSPEVKLTRAQFLVMIMRAYDIDIKDHEADNFSDAGNTYYTDYLKAAKALGITNGTGNNLFEPEKTITRQEMFTLLYNTLKLINQLPYGNLGKKLSDFSDENLVAPWAKEAMQILTETKIITGSEGKLNPEGYASRAEMAQLIYNLLSR